MQKTEVKEVVSETLNQLLKGNMIKYSDLIICDQIGERLKIHYKEYDESLAVALEQLKSHPYYGVLEMYYRDNMTLEQISETYYCDLSTIQRNKKHLCIKLFELAV